MYGFVKVICIVAYLLGAAAAVGLLPPPYTVMSRVAAILLVAHVLETVVMFKYVKRYQGPLAISVLLSILFGLAHWRPLMRS